MKEIVRNSEGWGGLGIENDPGFHREGYRD